MPRVRGGFTEADARDLRERLDPLIRKDSPLSEPVKKPKATWVEPVIEAEVAYSTMTEHQLLREAVLKGLCEDRKRRRRARWPARPCGRPAPGIGSPRRARTSCSSWAVHFLLIYKVNALACARGFAEMEIAGIGIVPLAALILTGVALAAIAAVLFVAAARRGPLRARQDSPSADFLRATALGIAMLSAVAIGRETIPVLIIGPCA